MEDFCRLEMFYRLFRIFCVILHRKLSEQNVSLQHVSWKRLYYQEDAMYACRSLKVGTLRDRIRRNQ